MSVCETSIPKLDEFLDGGLKQYSIALFWAYPGIDNSPFAYQIMMERLEKGDSCIYVTESKSSKTVENEVRHYGWDISDYKEKGKFLFVDAYSGLIDAKSPERFVVEDARNTKSLTKVLKKALKDTKTTHTLVVYDSLSTLIDHCGEDSIDELALWKKSFKENNATGVFLFTEWPYEDKVLNKLKLAADAIIQLKAIEEKVILREYFTVSKVNWDGKAKQGHGVPFKITSPGGVKVYIPKILVTGPFNAGKSSFVHSASSRAVSVERVGTTVALDHGHVDHAGFSVDLFGTPGQERFDPLLKLLGGEALGVIVMIDSTDPDGAIRAKKMMEKAKAVGLPYVIAANKTNLKGAVEPEKLRDKMGLAKDIQIIPVTAEDLSKVHEDEPTKLNDKDVHKVLDALFSRVV
ncbi:MAG: ATPase domain-containing protein [Candidatus Altiarchaeota archaeon]|nr:ATPase domain-containing protein [Candidatus Altiarchaeota archaeon]